MNGLLCRRVKPGFLQTDSVSSNVSPARAFICSETTVKEDGGQVFPQYGFHPVKNTAGHTTAAGQTVQGGVVHCHLCDEAKTFALSLTECPGVSTQPFPASVP